MKHKKKLPTWLQPRSLQPPMPVVVVWYTEAEWAKVKAASVDAERFEQTYAAWVRIAEKAVVDLRAAGIVTQRSYVKANDLLAWCLVHNKPNDAGARAQFASLQGPKPAEVDG
ncbi:MAG: hypothetical protein JWP29_4966 [Rhodoferax sp.]|nr:hypothetical protein [Rhodoferax sp.]